MLPNVIVENEKVLPTKVQILISEQSITSEQLSKSDNFC